MIFTLDYIHQMPQTFNQTIFNNYGLFLHCFFYIKHLHSNIKPTVTKHTYIYIYIHMPEKKQLHTKEDIQKR